MFLYKKWNFIILLNNLILSNFLCLQKKIFFLQFDIYKYYFYNFSQTTHNLKTRLISIKAQYNWEKI